MENIHLKFRKYLKELLSWHAVLMDTWLDRQMDPVFKSPSKLKLGGGQMWICAEGNWLNNILWSDWVAMYTFKEDFSQRYPVPFQLYFS